MKPLTTNSMLMMEQSMRFLWTKQTALLDNIANAETPNYKAKVVTFEEELAARLASAGRSARPASRARAILESSHPAVFQAQETARMDGNGVNVSEQQLELSRNGLQMQYTLGAINSDLMALRTAIKGQ